MTERVGTDAQERVADIYDLYASRVAAYALRRSANADAADVVAETFLVAWRRRDDVPEEPETLPWLYGVARRVLSNQRRTHHRRGRLKDRLESEFLHHRPASPQIEDVDEFRRMTRSLAKLSNTDAEVLRLLAWEALSPTEIATTMGITPATARQRIHRARQRLRKQLAKDGFDGDLFDRPRNESGHDRQVHDHGEEGTAFSYTTIRPGAAS